MVTLAVSLLLIFMGCVIWKENVVSGDVAYHVDTGPTEELVVPYRHRYGIFVALPLPLKSAQGARCRRTVLSRRSCDEGETTLATGTCTARLLSVCKRED